MKELDKRVLKVLLSRTRIKILKSLNERRKTVSELSRELKLSKSTVYEHLTKLIQIGFVKKLNNPGHKWVYYELTEKGYEFVKIGVKEVVLTLLAVISFSIGIYELLTHLIQPKQALLRHIKSLGAELSLNTLLGVLFLIIGVVFVISLVKIRRSYKRTL